VRPRPADFFDHDRVEQIVKQETNEAPTREPAGLSPANSRRRIETHPKALRLLKWLGRNFHYGASALLALCLLPLLLRNKLPLRYAWGVLVSTYCVFGAQSLFLAGSLLVTTHLAKVDGLGRHLRQLGIRLLLGIVCVIVLLRFFTEFWAIVLAADMSLIAAFLTRYGWRKCARTVLSFLVPAAYFFGGLVLIASYNDIILSRRFFAADDRVFEGMDEWLLHGWSVPRLCHWALSIFPLNFFHFLEWIYYGLFPVIGLGLIFACLRHGRRRGMQFVGAILTAYYLALALFYVWPSQGPYYLCPRHFANFPRQLQTYWLQEQSIRGATALWNHIPLDKITFVYFIAFPCIHITQGLIVLWFLRRWKAIRVALLVYNVLLAGAIVLLEWHYLVDIIAGVLIAGIAVIAVEGGFGFQGDTSGMESGRFAAAK